MNSADQESTAAGRQERLERLTRLHAASSRINRAIVRAQSRDELLEEVCRILVESGRLRRAWIGWADPETGAVLPLAQHVGSTASLRDLQISAAEQPDGSDRAVTCILEGRPCVGNDLEEESRTHPSLALPLRFQQKVLGVLVLCAPVEDFFGEEETSLLEEAALDVSYALDQLESEAQRRKTEASLRQSEERFRLALSAAHLGVWEWNIETDAVTWSPECYAIYGLESMDGTFASFACMLHPEDAPLISTMAERAITDRTAQTAEYRLIRPSGEVIWVSDYGQAYFNDEGHPLRLVGVVQEITERKRAEAALRESEERLDRIVETTPAGIVIVGLDGRISFANPAGERLLGLTRDGAAGRPYREPKWAFTTLDGQPFPRERLPVRRVMASNAPVHNVEHAIESADGRRVMFSVNAAPLHDASGGVTGVTAAFTDITERTIAERERVRMERDLRQAQKMEAIGTLAGGVAHDFNNLLTPILAHCELALLKLAEGHPVRAHLSGVLTAAERAQALVRQILAISRRDEDAEAPVPVSLGALVKETIKFLRASFPSTIEIRGEADAARGWVKGSPSHLHQVILNLCANARDAIGERGGTVTMSVEEFTAEPVADAQGGGRSPELRPWVRLSVQDTGEGMPPSVLERIFEPYFTTKPAGRGTGLGLAVTRGIVRGLGGSIVVHSTPGEGTTFEVILPKAQTDGATQPATAPRLPRGHGQHVLVVDDEAAIGTVLAQMLAALGYRATVCASGAEAVRTFQSDPSAFDAVLADYTMPGLTGLATAGELLRIRADLPILLGTGFAEAVNERTVEAHGLRGLILKPYNLQKLSAALLLALG